MFLLGGAKCSNRNVTQSMIPCQSQHKAWRADFQKGLPSIPFQSFPACKRNPDEAAKNAFRVGVAQGPGGALAPQLHAK